MNNGWDMLFCEPEMTPVQLTIFLLFSPLIPYFLNVYERNDLIVMSALPLPLRACFYIKISQGGRNLSLRHCPPFPVSFCQHLPNPPSSPPPVKYFTVYKYVKTVMCHDRPHGWAVQIVVDFSKGR